MSKRLEAWLGFTDGKCNEDTQLLIDDIKCLVENLQAAEEREKILRKAVELIKSIANLEAVNPSQDASVWFASDAIRCRAFLKSLEEKEGER